MGRRETVSDVFLATLHDLGLRVLFVDPGTVCPPIGETLAKYRARGQPLPAVALCPHERAAIPAARSGIARR